MTHQSLTELEAGLDHVRAAPSDLGTVELLVRRPGPGERELLNSGQFDLRRGLVGDRWGERAKNPDFQVTATSARMTSLIAAGDDPERWAEAGDQLYLDFDLSVANLPVGAWFEIGEARFEVTPPPHRGCGKYERRFGADALELVRSPLGQELRLRGVHARVVEAGAVTVGDVVRTISPVSG